MLLFLAFIFSTLLLITLLLNFFYSCIFLPCNRHSHFHRQGLRGPPRRLILGNSGDLRRLMAAAQSNPMDFHHRILQRAIPHYYHWSARYGPAFIYWFGSTPRLAVSSPDLIKEVLVNHGGAYGLTRKSPLAGQLFGGGLVALAGEKWARHRRIANSAFSSERVKNWVPVAIGCTEKMLDAWEEKYKNQPESCEIEVHGELHGLTADVISRTAFGSSYEYSRRVFQLQEQQMSLVSQALRSIYIPGFRFLPTKKNIRRRRLEKEINGLLRKLIEINWDDQSDSSRNLLGQMISSNKNQKEEDRISIEEIIGECKTFYFAGKETTANLLTWAFLLLALHQDWQDRGRQEVLHVLGPHGMITSDNLSQLKLVGMILDETLRLYAPAVMLMRETTKHVRLGKFELPAGTQLYLAMLAVHHDRELWGEDAEEFNPMRFSEPRMHLAAFFPFGLGPRICVGQLLASAEARIIVAMVLRRFKLKVSPSYKHAPIQFITLQPQFGAPILFDRI